MTIFGFPQEMIDEEDNFLNSIPTPKWTVMTMSELWDHFPVPEDLQKVFVKPTFPTSRWGKTYTLTSTTDILAINRLVTILKEKGYTVRKRICHASNRKFRNRGKFYMIEQKI